MSTASFGVVGLSSASTITPAARALRMAGTTPGPAGGMRMVETPDARAVSIALDWTSSESVALYEVIARSTPCLAASALAASAIFLKYGFVSAATSKATFGPAAEALPEQTRASSGAIANAAAKRLLERSRGIVDRVIPR